MRFGPGDEFRQGQEGEYFTEFRGLQVETTAQGNPRMRSVYLPTKARDEGGQQQYDSQGIGQVGHRGEYLRIRKQDDDAQYAVDAEVEELFGVLLVKPQQVLQDVVPFPVFHGENAEHPDEGDQEKQPDRQGIYPLGDGWVSGGRIHTRGRDLRFLLSGASISATCRRTVVSRLGGVLSCLGGGGMLSSSPSVSANSRARSLAKESLSA